MLSRNSKGFSLIELLVVMTIIAVLATVGLTVFSSAQKSGRIAKRVEDLNAIRSALEVYYSQNKSYPTTSGTWRSECGNLNTSSPSFGISSATTVNNVIPGLVPNYLVALPADPGMNTTASPNRGCYVYKSDGVDFKFVIFDAPDMVAADYTAQRNFVDPARTNAWAIYSSSNSSGW